jgi:acetyl esterase/lipase
MFAAGADWPTRRRRMELAVGGLPLPLGDVRVSPIQLDRVPAERVAPATAGQLTLLYLHGGGYTVGSARTHRWLGARLASRLNATGYVLDYRLAPEHGYPAASDDALAAYRALVKVGKPVVVAGDSAGGGLALSVALAARAAELPAPAAIGLLYPWLDLTAEGMAALPAAPREPMLTAELLGQFADAYVPESQRGGERVSPLRADLTGLPPIVLDACGDDLLVDQARDLADRVRSTGGRIEYREHPGAFHGYHALAPLVPGTTEAVDSFAQTLRTAATATSR